MEQTYLLLKTCLMNLNVVELRNFEYTKSNGRLKSANVQHEQHAALIDFTE